MSNLAHQPLPERQKEAQRVAVELFKQQPDWEMFFREILGTEGVLRKLFPDPQQLGEFEKTQEYREIQRMLAALRSKKRSASENKEPTRVITVRLPKSLHESLRDEAYERQTSINKLCITKLVQVLAAPEKTPAPDERQSISAWRSEEAAEGEEE